jgi:shikimate dehydrogenase
MNTVARAPDGELFGTNTDAAGFFGPISDRDWAGASAAVVGAGGAARAILFALAKVGIGEVILHARSALKGAALLARFGLKGAVRPLDAALAPVQLLVNASPLGMAGQPVYDPDLAALPDDAIVYDCVYAPLDTPMLLSARAAGLETVDGLEMLVGQAAVAFELFFGKPPPADDAALRARLAGG